MYVCMYVCVCMYVYTYVTTYAAKITNNNFNRGRCLPVRLLAAQLLIYNRQPVFLVRMQAIFASDVRN